jgi:hypothetical protein
MSGTGIDNKQNASESFTKKSDPNEMCKKSKRFYRWLHSIVREVPSKRSEESEIGEIIFKVKDVTHSVPFTALLELADARGKNNKKFEKVKADFEKKHGPVKEILNNLKLLVGSLKKGSKLARDAGIEDTPGPTTYFSDEME